MAFNFNVPKTSAPSVFGSTPPVAAVAATPAFGGGFNFGATSQPTSTAPTFGLGGGSANPMASNTAQASVSTFNFNKPATTTAATLNFGTTTTSGGGLLGKPTTAIAPTPATTAPPFAGLGGVDISQTQPKAGDQKPDNIKTKETQVPDEIVKTVDALKTHIKLQKTLASDIGRTSTSKLTNVSSEAKNLLWCLQEIANAVESNYNQIKMLRQETSKTLQAVEIAQRTQDTPTGLQYENVAPFQFFSNLVEKYEQDLINIQHQISATEHHMYSLTNPKSVSAEELKLGFKQINECFISLAGRLHEIHQKVEAQKEQYLNLRKYRLRDSTNVFAHLEKTTSKFDNTNVVSGPTPFSSISGISNLSKTINAAANANSVANSALPGVK